MCERRAIGALLAIGLWVAGSPAAAQNPEMEKSRQRLEQIRAERERLRQEQERLQSQVRDAGRELDNLERQRREGIALEESALAKLRKLAGG
jgi:uncharacterized protein YlxW (UPF0749 family)